MAKVSIVLPIYNVEQYLRECLDSVINQTLKEIEIICVNDGSTDGSLVILQEYAARDERIKIIDKSNSGYGHSMNVGIDAATGEYLGIVEPDDYILPNMYETLYNIAKSENLDLIKADFYRFTGSGASLKKDYNQLSKDKSYYGRVIDPKDDINVFRFIMNTWSGIYNLNFINKFNIRHNETPGASFQDNGFWFQTFCRAQRIYFLNEPFYMNRRDNPNSSVKNRSKVYAGSDEYKYIYNFLEKNPELKEKFIYIYSVKKYQHFKFTMQRIDIKFQAEFLKYFSNEFKNMKKRGELDEKMFYKFEWNAVNKIIEMANMNYDEQSYEKYINRYKKIIIFEKICEFIEINDIQTIIKKIINKFIWK